MQTFEVIARIGDSIIDCAYLSRGSRYQLGGATIEIERRANIRVGLAVLAIAPVATPRGELPRPRFDVRPIVYLLASAVAQLAVVLVAELNAPLERLRPPPERIVHVKRIAPPPAVAPPSRAARVEAPATPHGTHPHAPRVAHAPPRDEPAADPQAIVAQYAARFAAEVDIEKLESSFDPSAPTGEPEPSGFGTSGHDIDDFTARNGTIAVVGWGLPTYIHPPGELAPEPAIEMCDDDSCLVDGALAQETVLAALAAHRAEIARCYREHTGDLVGTIRIRFELAPDGRVHDVLGAGTGTVGRCVAKIAAQIAWPAANARTRVFVGMKFQPANAN